MTDKGKDNEKFRKVKNFFIERSYRIDIGYLNKFRELITDLSIDVKKNFDRKKRDFFVRPRAPGKYPAVIVLHDWWGMNDYIRRVCMRFGKEGFVAQAVSLFDGEETERAEVARILMRYLDPDKVIATVQSYVDLLKTLPFVNGRKIALVGFLMGGYYALQSAAHVRGVAAVVAYYGRFPRSVIEEINKISIPVLFIAGGTVDWLEREEVKEIAEGLLGKGKKGRVLHYPHVSQAFFDDRHIDEYDYISAEDAWKQGIAFLKAELRRNDNVLHPQLRRVAGPFGEKVIDRMEKFFWGKQFLDLLEAAIGDDEGNSVNQLRRIKTPRSQ